MEKQQHKFRLGLNIGISEVFSGDPWFRRFYMEIAHLYGYPTSTEAAMSNRDKALSAYATVNISMALEEHRSEWIPFWRKKVTVTPQLAEDFCRKVFELRGEHIIPFPS